MSGAASLKRIAVGVIVERRKAASPWIDHTWRVHSVLEGAPAAEPWTVLAGESDAATFYAGEADIELFRLETTNYRDNLQSGSPSLWVSLRPTGIEPPFDLMGVTADPAEGEAWTETGSDLVEAVPMPHRIKDEVAAFVAEHHVERTFFKRKRDRADPEALARRAPFSEPDE